MLLQMTVNFLSFENRNHFFLLKSDNKQGAATGKCSRNIVLENSSARIRGKALCEVRGCSPEGMRGGAELRAMTGSNCIGSVLVFWVL